MKGEGKVVIWEETKERQKWENRYGMKLGRDNETETEAEG